MPLRRHSARHSCGSRPPPKFTPSVSNSRANSSHPAALKQAIEAPRESSSVPSMSNRTSIRASLAPTIGRAHRRPQSRLTVRATRRTVRRVEQHPATGACAMNPATPPAPSLSRCSWLRALRAGAVVLLASAAAAAQVHDQVIVLALDLKATQHKVYRFDRKLQLLGETDPSAEGD